MSHTWKFKYTFLFSFLILALILYPYLDGEGPSGYILKGLFLAILFSSVYAASQDRKHVLIGCLLLFPSLLGHILVDSGLARALDRNRNLLSVPLYWFVIVTILRSLLRREKVTGDILCGAASVYILTGIAWVPLYIAIENYFPGSFKTSIEGPISPDQLWGELVYFSFTTLTTLGYGDISPLSAQAKSLTNLEAINGVLYIAVLVSKLVGLNAQWIASEEP